MSSAIVESPMIAPCSAAMAGPRPLVSSRFHNLRESGALHEVDAEYALQRAHISALVSSRRSHAGDRLFTDSTLCIGCKACEVACKEWNELPEDGFVFSGASYDNTLASATPRGGM